MHEPEPLQQLNRTYVLCGSRKLSYFAGCDYYRLASHPRVIAALKNGADRFGLNVAASRLTTGNHRIYRDLERRLARFFAAPDALLVSSGYVTNLVVAQALVGSFSHVLLDDRSHGSLRDTAQMFDCPVLQFRHRDAADLKDSLARCGEGSRPVLLTDGMFSHDGSVAPLDQYFKLLPRDAWMLVDDAHGGGVVGESGRGSLEHCKVSRARTVQTVTLSKAFGAYGGAVLCSPRLRQLILRKSRMFIGSTPLPPPLACCALTALSILEQTNALREQLTASTRAVRSRLRAAGMNSPENPGPIIAVHPANSAQAQRIRSCLLRNCVFPSFIKYPGGPAQGYFRFVISSEHTKFQLDRLVRALVKAGVA